MREEILPPVTGGVYLLANLKAALAARNLRQADLAAALKVSPGLLSEIVRGRREAPATLRTRIAEILRADERWLFTTVRIPNKLA